MSAPSASGWRSEGVVDDGERSFFPRHSRDHGDIDHFQHGVGGRFQPDQLGLVDAGKLNTQLFEDIIEHAERAAIHIVTQQHVVSGREQMDTGGQGRDT